MRNLLIWAMLFSSGCSWFSASLPPREDRSIRFPNFHEHLATSVGGQGQLFAMDGVTLKAITIAANDFAPSRARQEQCETRQESQRYEVIRQGDIVFVEISANPAACGMKLMMLDGGAKYAIHTDGRILRRLFDGEPEDTQPDAADADGAKSNVTFVPDSQVGAIYGPRAAEGVPKEMTGGERPSNSPSSPARVE